MGFALRLVISYHTIQVKYSPRSRQRLFIFAFCAAVQKAQEKAKNGDYVMIDVRPRARYDEGRIPGALSVPLYQKVSALPCFQLRHLVACRIQ